MPPTQTYRARLRYISDYDDGRHHFIVAIECRVESLSFRTLLDTASQWCVLPPETAQTLGFDMGLSPVETPVQLSARFGTLAGRLERIPLHFSGAEGDEIEVEATWFISADWPGPAVIGWKGCLERIRFALDPSDDSFYFGNL
jgi:hypothetical protein